MIKRQFFVYFILSIIIPTGLFAWNNDPKVNTQIAFSTWNQIDHDAISDGAGGAFVCWAQKVGDKDIDFDIYAQRIDSHGNAVWSEPTKVCTAFDFQGLPKMTTDGVGGVYIAWHDSRGGMNPDFSNLDVYAQRVDKEGKCLWQKDGIVICDQPSWQVYVAITATGEGCAAISWDDGRSGDCQVYCQKVDRTGKCLWVKDGVLLANIVCGQTDTKVVSDGDGGAIISWTDVRQLGNMDVYCQRVNSKGERSWGETGLPLANIPGEQFFTRLTSDGAGGAIITWVDSRLGSDEFDIYSQHVSHAGKCLWPDKGLPICQAPGSQLTVAITSDGEGGAIFAWEDGRKKNSDTDIYAQRITSDGVALWDKDGKAIASTTHAQARPAVLSDGSGGAFIVWQDFYRGGAWWNIYAQRIGWDGKEKWQKDGIPVCIADGTQSDPLPVSGGANGPIIFWFDGREISHYNIFAQQIDFNGLLGGGEFTLQTADKDGKLLKSFKPEEWIRFQLTWFGIAPQNPGNYTALSLMSINNQSNFQQQLIHYDVSEKKGEEK